MRVWLVTIGEPLPTDAEGSRLHRTGTFARLLASRGHDVLWWTSAFDHMRKTHRAPDDKIVEPEGFGRIWMMRARGYSKNVSIARILDHRAMTRRFYRLALTQPPPDVIVAAMPTPGLALASAKLGRKLGVAAVVDVRDLWSDVFLELVPQKMRWLARGPLRPMNRAVRKACAQATAIIGVTPHYVQWGLEKARRRATDLDRDFPLGYTEKAPQPDAVEKAREFWRANGLSGETAEFTACFFGTLGRQFDIETIIEAARRLETDERPFRFVICGAGESLERYKQMAGGLGSVVFPGWIGQAEIYTLMRMSKVGLAPYYSIENFRKNLPNKPVEYLSAGLPIVSSLEGVLEALLSEHDCGVTYRNGDVARLTAMMRELHDSPDRLREMSGKARALFEKRFPAEKVYGQMADYLQEVVAAGEARRARPGRKCGAALGRREGTD